MEIVSIIFTFTIIIPLALKALYIIGVLLVWITGVFEALIGDCWRPLITHETSEWVRSVLRLQVLVEDPESK